MRSCELSLESIPLRRSRARASKEYECERWTWDRFVEEGIANQTMRGQSSSYLLEEIKKEFPILHDKGLDERARDYLLEVDRDRLFKLYDEFAQNAFHPALPRGQKPLKYFDHVTDEEHLRKAFPDI
jgi:hypothetical protein